MSSFDDAFAQLIGNEGGYSDNPADPGGETMFGVTKRVAIANGYAGDMRALTIDVAKRIAKTQYWDKYQCDQFDSRIAFQVFDAAYNGGHPAQWLQRAVGATQDGIIGATTVACVRASDPVKITSLFNAYRLQYFTSLPTWATFGRGWANRIASNLIKGVS